MKCKYFDVLLIGGYKRTIQDCDVTIFDGFITITKGEMVVKIALDKVMWCEYKENLYRKGRDETN